MSPPDTNVPKQTRRHWPSLLGMVAIIVLIVVLVLATGIVTFNDDTAGSASDADSSTQAD